MHVWAPPLRTRWWQNTAPDAKVKNNKGTNPQLPLRMRSVSFAE